MADTERCAKCGVELSFKEMFSTGHLCACCERNEQDKSEQRQERQWKFDDGRAQ